MRLGRRGVGRQSRSVNQQSSTWVSWPCFCVSTLLIYLFISYILAYGFNYRQKQFIKKKHINKERKEEIGQKGIPLISDSIELDKLCPLRKNICIKDRHFIVRNEQDSFTCIDYPCLMFGTGIHPKHKTYRQHLYSNVDPSYFDSGKCGELVDESIILLHAWYPHMLWEVWMRIAMPLFEYQIIDGILSKKHRFAIMQLDGYELSEMHELLLGPFTDFPFVHLKDLMYNETSSLINTKGNYVSYKVSKSCSCYKEIYFCGFKNRNISRDGKQLQHSNFKPSFEVNGGYTWDMARYYKWYYFKKYGNIPNNLINKNKIKGIKRLLFIQRKSWKRQWENLDILIPKCNNERPFEFECKIIYFEDLNHIETLWHMSQCDMLIGIHGSGLVNGIFGPEKSTVLEIIPVRAPNYAKGDGTIMQWLFESTPQRHSWFPLKEGEQPSDKDRDWQKAFTLSWERLKPFLLFLIDNKHNFCPIHIPKSLKNDKFRIGKKKFNKIVPMFHFKPNCNNLTYLDKQFNVI